MKPCFGNPTRYQPRKEIKPPLLCDVFHALLPMGGHEEISPFMKIFSVQNKKK
jgi:hypothetical protein